MSTTSSTNISLLKPAGTTRRLSREALVRFGLVPVAVGICYLFEWQWLRLLTLQLNTFLVSLAGIQFQQLTNDTIVWRGIVYHYHVACTFADVWCGALPLIWNRSKTVGWNLTYALAVGLGLLAFNVFRLSFSDVMFGIGVPWVLAHHVVSGISYYLVWQWLWRTKSWEAQTAISTQ